MTTSFKQFLAERIYSKGDDLIISLQHEKESSNEEAISTFIRRNPYQSTLVGAKDATVYSILNYVSSQETTKLLRSLKGQGPYNLKPRQYEMFLDQVVDQCVMIFGKLHPDAVILPSSSSSFLNDLCERLKKKYTKAKYFNDAFVKRALDAENVEPLINKEHPDWEKFSTEHPKDASDLRKTLARQIKTNGALELKKLYKPLLKFVKNFVELKDAYQILDNILERRVIVMDDVLSSGSTMVEMVRQLKEMEPTFIAGLTIFKRTSAVKEAAVNVEELVDEYIELMKDPKVVREKFGTGTFNEICEEAGNCAMVSEDLVNWLDVQGVSAKTYTAFYAKNPAWTKHAKIRPRTEEDAHTVVKVGNKIIDLTARQFDPKLLFPRIISLSQFNSEWENADSN